MTTASCAEPVETAPDFGRCPQRYQDHSQNGETETCRAPAVGSHGYCEPHRKSRLAYAEHKLEEHQREADYFAREIEKLTVSACACASPLPSQERPKPAMLTVNGIRFKCPTCKATVFAQQGSIYTCNGCGAEYEGS